MRSFGLALVWASILVGCRGDAITTVSTQPAPFLRAAVTSSAELPDAYEGTGEFSTDDARRLGRGPVFSVFSQSRDGRGERSLLLYQDGEGRPGRGEYDVATPDSARTPRRMFGVIYTRIVDGWYEAYVSRSGAVTITESTPDRLTGRFELSGVRYYRRPVLGQSDEAGLVLGRPDAPPQGQPTLNITGTFDAQPRREMLQEETNP